MSETLIHQENISETLILGVLLPGRKVRQIGEIGQTNRKSKRPIGFPATNQCNCCKAYENKEMQ